MASSLPIPLAPPRHAPSQHDVLDTLGNGVGMRVREIADDTGREWQAVRNALGRLEARGLVAVSGEHGCSSDTGKVWTITEFGKLELIRYRQHAGGTRNARRS